MARAFEPDEHGVQLVPQESGEALSRQLLPHRWYPLLQVMAQTPFTQVGWPLATVGHTFPHWPQFVALVSLLTQLPEHKSGVPGLLHPEVHS